MPAFTKVDSDVDALIDRVMTLHHPDLSREGVTVNALQAWPKLELRLHGYPVLAFIKINSVKERVQGLADATIVINGFAWQHLTGGKKTALIDHELQHLSLVLKKKSSDAKVDSHGRPKLRMRRHDWQLGGFAAVAERHGVDALEVAHVREVMGNYRQLLLNWGDDRAANLQAEVTADVKRAVKRTAKAAGTTEQAVREAVGISPPKAKVKVPKGQPNGTVGHNVGKDGGMARKPRRKGKVTELYAERA